MLTASSLDFTVFDIFANGIIGSFSYDLEVGFLNVVKQLQHAGFQQSWALVSKWVEMI